MPSTVSMPDGIYYRVNHPEFRKDLAYKALFITVYAESGWDHLTFINERGMTYSVKNWRCFCLNGQRATLKHQLAIEAQPSARCSEHYVVKERKLKATTMLHHEVSGRSVSFFTACWTSYPLWLEPDQEFIDLPFPRPVCKNPDLDGDE